MYMSGKWRDRPAHMRVVKFREDLAHVTMNKARKSKPLEIEALKRRARKIVLDEEGDYVPPSRPPHVYRDRHYGYTGDLVKRLLAKAARRGWYWDDLYKVASEVIKPRYEPLRALFKRPSNSEYSQRNRTTNDWYATSDEAGRVVMKEKWNAKKIKDVSLPLHAAHDRMVAARGDYELRSVRQKIDCGCVDYGYRSACAHGNKWPVKYVWFKIKREMRSFTEFETQWGRTRGYEYVLVTSEKLVEASRHCATKKDIAKLAPLTQDEIKRFLWDLR